MKTKNFEEVSFSIIKESSPNAIASLKVCTNSRTMHTSAVAVPDNSTYFIFESSASIVPVIRDQLENFPSVSSLVYLEMYLTLVNLTDPLKVYPQKSSYFFERSSLQFAFVPEKKIIITSENDEGQLTNFFSRCCNRSLFICSRLRSLSSAFLLFSNAFSVSNCCFLSSFS